VNCCDMSIVSQKRWIFVLLIKGMNTDWLLEPQPGQGF